MEEPASWQSCLTEVLGNRRELHHPGTLPDPLSSHMDRSKFTFCMNTVLQSELTRQEGFFFPFFLKMGNVLRALVLFLPLGQTWIKSLHLNQTEGHWKEEETVQTWAPAPKASPLGPKHNNTTIYMIWGWSKSPWNDEKQGSESQSLRKLAVRWDIVRLFESLCLLGRQKQTWALLQKYFLIE